MGDKKTEVDLRRRSKLKKFLTFSGMAVGSAIFARFGGFNRILAGVIGDMKDDEMNKLRKKRDKEIRRFKNSDRDNINEKISDIQTKYSKMINKVANDKKLKISKLIGV